MARLWHEALGADVDCAATGDVAVEVLQRTDYDVVLVNRLLAADGSSGLEVIERLLALRRESPVMLVSDRTNVQGYCGQARRGARIRRSTPWRALDVGFGLAHRQWFQGTIAKGEMMP
jgi:DNA-binding response OmpR family regulator